MPDTSSVSSDFQHPDEGWFMDSGATLHLSCDASSFYNSVPYQGDEQLTVGNGKQISISNIGHVSLASFHKPIILQHVLHTPAISKRLISIARLCDSKAFIEFYATFFLVKDLKSKKILLRGTFEDGLYKLQSTARLSPPSSTCHATAFLSLVNNTPIWHLRLGHPAASILKLVLSQCRLSTSHVNTFCNACQVAKSHRLPFISVITKTIAPLQLVHSNVWGPSPQISVNGACFFILFVDDYTHFSWLYLLKSKDEAFSCFLNFKQLVETQFDKKIKSLQTN